MTENRFTVFFSEEMLYEATSGFFELEASPFLEVVEQHPENPTRYHAVASSHLSSRRVTALQNTASHGFDVAVLVLRVG